MFLGLREICTWLRAQSYPPPHYSMQLPQWNAFCMLGWGGRVIGQPAGHKKCTYYLIVDCPIYFAHAKWPGGMSDWKMGEKIWQKSLLPAPSPSALHTTWFLPHPVTLPALTLYTMNCLHPATDYLPWNCPGSMAAGIRHCSHLVAVVKPAC